MCIVIYAGRRYIVTYVLLIPTIFGCFDEFSDDPDLSDAAFTADNPDSQLARIRGCTRALCPCHFLR